MFRVPSLFGLLMSLCLALASGGLAVARVQPPMTAWLDLCAAGAASRIAVDAQGQPVGSIHLCPDCTAAFSFAAMPDQPVLTAPLSVHSRPIVVAPLVTVRAAVPPPIAAARGPPAVI
jgi:hypothetical protein